MVQDQSLTLQLAEGHPVSTLHVPDSSMTLNDVLKVNGFTPRDGSFRFLIDDQGTMINHREAAFAPSLVRCGEPSDVEQLWIDGDAKRGFAPAVRSNGENVVVLNGRAFDFQTVYITKWKRGPNKNHRVAYQFSPESPFYEASNLVYLRVPNKGNIGQIYNPKTGCVDFDVRLNAPQNELDGMRGFWSAWQLQPDLASATFRGDITPLPSNFKPFVQTAPQRASSMPSPEKKKRNVRLNKLRVDAVGSGLHKGSLKYKNYWSKALVCGVSRTPERLNGVLVATKNATRPAMVNLDGYQFGMTQFIKIPEEGEIYELFAPAQQTHVSCIIRSSPELNLENLRGRWVIARLQRCNRHKRKLVLEALPSQFYEEHFC